MAWQDYMNDGERALMEQLDRTVERYNGKLKDVHTRRARVRNTCVLRERKVRMRRNPNDTD